MDTFKSVRWISLLAMMLVSGGFYGCGSSAADGQMSLSLTDAATDQYNGVYVTIDEVQVPRSETSGNSWQTILTPQKTYNLLDLANGVRESLGIASLTAGHYTQMRLVLGNSPDAGINILSQSHPFANYVIDTDNTYHELKVPSGSQTGIKIVQGFDISANETTELILDFNAAASVVIAGSSGQYLLKPTIKILTTTEFAILNGTITAAADGSVLAGALVTAQVFDSAAVDARDRVSVESGTVSDDAGSYALFLEPSSYTIVAYKTGFAPSASAVTLVAGSTSTLDFALVAATMGAVSGTVTISGADSETFATLSFRQSMTIADSLQEIEVMSLNVGSGGSYAINLPDGTYTVVSSSANQTTQTSTVTVVGNASVTLDVNF